jgi:hypothetical protein
MGKAPDRTARFPRSRSVFSACRYWTAEEQGWPFGSRGSNGYKTDILNGPGKLYKQPGYNPLE